MNLSLQTLDGSSIQTSSYTGKILIVVFFASWSEYSVEINQNIFTLLQNNSLPKVVFFSVTIDPVHDIPAILTNFINSNNLQSIALNSSQWLFARDVNEQYKNYGVGSIPDSFLVDQQSIIRDQKIGLMNSAMFDQWITAVNSSNYLSSSSVINSSSYLTSSSLNTISTSNLPLIPTITVFFILFIVNRKRRTNL